MKENRTENFLNSREEEEDCIVTFLFLRLRLSTGSVVSGIQWRATFLDSSLVICFSTAYLQISVCVTV